jgi:hypothetical protein
MDETRLRAVIREEIALAMKTLEDQTYSSDPDDDVSLERALSYFNTYAYRGACEAADEQRAQNAANPFEETSLDGERRRVTHAAAFLPTADLNALPAGAYKLLGNLARNDAYTNAVIRLMQHGGPSIGKQEAETTGVNPALAAKCGRHNFVQLRDGWFCLHCGTPTPTE